MDQSGSLTGADYHSRADNGIVVIEVGRGEGQLQKLIHPPQAFCRWLEYNIPPKSKAQLFSLKRRAFFPEPNEVPIGHPDGQSGTSVTYIKDYHNAIKENSDQAKYLKDALDIICQHLQILPFNPGGLAQSISG